MPSTVTLRPITVEDAEVMAGVLADPSLYEFIGGDPTEIAWVIGRPWQGLGHASAAAQLLVELLRQRGVQKLVAHIHPRHSASEAVARRLGMTPTDVVVDGETRWEG